MSQNILGIKQVQLVSEKALFPKRPGKTPAVTPLKISANARRVIEKRYLLKDRDLKPIETLEEMFRRVARHIAQADRFYGATKEKIAQTENDFYNLMAGLEFLPNSPTFTGAGTKLGQLSACFVLPIEDDMQSILKTQMDMGLIHKSGGGTGFSFSKLRPKNDVVGTTGGVSSGPIGFLQMYNDTTECIKQGGTRRGANMGILRVNHPDILDFIRYKEKEGTLANFNISVALTKDFMNALQTDKNYPLINPRSGEITGHLNAREVFDKIVESAWRNGEPGIIFLDKINEKNPTPNLGEIEATNPCIAGDTFISTENGLIKIKDLAKNSTKNLQILTDEVVFGHLKPSSYFNGPVATLGKTERKLSLNKITRVFKTGKKPVYKVVTESGYEVAATADHKFYTNRGWVELRNIRPHDHNLFIQSQEGFFEENYDLPFEVKNQYRGKNGRKYILDLPSKWSKKLGEIIGLIIGDGWLINQGQNCRLGLTFGSQNQDVLDYAKKILNSYYLKDIKPVKRANNVYHLSYHSRYLINFFYALGILPKKAKHKRIPESIFTSPREAVVGFLRGLFSADGTICWSENNTRYARLTSKSLPLLKDTQILLLNLGIQSKIYNRARDARYGFEYTNVNGTKKNYKLDGELYELQIAKESLKRFLIEVGFLNQKYQPLIARLKEANFYHEQYEEKIIKIEFKGIQEVFDLTEPYTQSFIANGIILSNCGEQPLLPYESCNLGAINLKKFTRSDAGKAQIDWEKLDRTIPLAVHFMDNVIDINKYPIPEIKEMTKQNRKMGITVMGFADLLYLLGIPYDSEEGLKTAEKIMGFIEKRSHEESVKLAQTRGEFPNFKDSIWDKKGLPKMRNAALTSCNPTGTLSIIGTCSSGIEPFFALAYTKTVMDNTALPEINEHFLKVAKEEGFFSDELLKKILEEGSVQEIARMPEKFKKVYKVASDIAPEWHVKMQAAFQKHTDGAISKTINFPNSATKEDVKKAYLLAYELNCKGLTVYRDGSRVIQVLTTRLAEGEPKRTNKKEDQAKKEKSPETVVASGEVKITPRKRPDIIRGYTYRVKTAYGKLFITINDDEFGNPFEVFSHLGKAGGFFAAKAEAICRLISLALRSGIDAREVIDQLKGIRGPTPTWTEDGRMILSLPDGIAQILEKHINKNQKNLALEFQTGTQPKLENIRTADQMTDGFSKTSPQSLADLGEAPACPECGEMLEFTEGCLKCHACGFSKCG